ncbi:Predicted alpha-1,6-mannanase, GH76 family [Micrococcales bacterium KH10]|nr:Predicted alpha-1,6-mannanase, GH76 family [Micrococcales bacterium KH10]
MRRQLPSSTFARTAKRAVGLAATAALAAPLALAVASTSASAAAEPDRVASSRTIEGRTIELLVDDTTGDVAARITGAIEGDEIWLDRSINGFDTWDGRLGFNDDVTGDTLISDPAADLNDRVGDDIALFRACARIELPEDDELVECTEGSRSRSGDALAAANGLLQYYNASSNIFDAPGPQIDPVSHHWLRWWHSAVATSALVETMRVTGDHRYLPLIEEIHTSNRVKNFGFGDEFRNEFIDDTGWWAMAWIDAYRLTGEQKYLDSAQIATEFMSQHWNSQTACGGIFWKLEHSPNNGWEPLGHLAAISNSLYLQVNAALYRETGDRQYLDEAEKEWQWYSSKGLIDNDGLVLDGVNRDGSPTRPECTAGGGKFTYNSGVIVSGLVEYYHATGNTSLLDSAQFVAHGITTSQTFSPGGILQDSCERRTDEWMNENPDERNKPVPEKPFNGYRCQNDGPVFKGPTVRGLGELNATLKSIDGTAPYSEYLDRQIATAQNTGSRQAGRAEGADLYGLRWYDDGANKLHVGNQVAGAMLANATAVTPQAAQPHVTLTTVPAAPTTSGWYRTTVTATAAATPNTDLEQSLGTGWSQYEGPRQFTDGEHLMSVRSTGSGRVISRWIRVDSLAPSVTATIPEFQRIVTLTASDATSGLDRIEYRLGTGPWQRYTTSVTVPLTQPSISYRAFDIAGNVSDVRTHSFGPQLGSRVQVSVQDAAIGAAASITARVSAADAQFANDLAATPTGTIQVSRDGRVIASGALRAGQVTLALPKDFNVGTHSLQVLYSGSGVFHSTSAGTTLRVTKTSATAKVKAKKKIKRSKRLKVTTTVRTATGVKARGKVRIRVFRGKKRVLQRNVKLNAKGKAKVKLPRIKKPGKYTVRVVYRGNAEAKQSKTNKSKLRVVR